MKESEQAVKAKENLIKDLNRASSDVNRDKELLQQQLEEMKVNCRFFSLTAFVFVLLAFTTK